MTTLLVAIGAVLAVALALFFLRRTLGGARPMPVRSGAFAWQKTNFGLPPMQDVGAANHDTTPLDGARQPVWFVGTDGSLWMFDGTDAKQVPSRADLTRIAVSPNYRKWCVDKRGTLWGMMDNNWTKIEVPGELVRDVAASADASVYAVMKNGRYYSFSGSSKPYYHGTLLAVDAIAGEAAASDRHPFGVAWGVSPMNVPNGLCYCAWDGWVLKSLYDVADLSVSADGTVWMVKTDGTIWTTTDGELQLRSDNVGGFKRISAGVANCWAVAQDGSVWMWAPVPSIPPSHPGSRPPSSTGPTPSPAPSPSAAGPPVISVSVTGAAESSVFRVSGSGFTPGAEVTVRGARIADGAIPHVYWTTAADGGGKISIDIGLPCIPGLVISFSANDGRADASDLTGKLWSNTVPATCPGG